MAAFIEKWHARSLRGKAHQLSVGCFGKLPLYADFLQSGAASKGAAALKRWVDQGYSKFWETADHRKDHVIQPHALLLHFKGTRRPVAAYIWGSHDRGELRRFPFTFYSELPRSIARRGALVLLDVLDQFATQCEEWRNGTEDLPDADGFNRWARRLVCKVAVRRRGVLKRRLRSEIGEITVADLASSCYGESAAREWPALLAYLDRQRKRARAGGLAVRLPGPNVLGTWAQLAVWHIVVQRHGRRAVAANLIHARNPKDTGVALLDRPLRAEDVYLFHPETDDYDFVEDLRYSVPTVGDPPPPLRDDEGERPLVDFLKAAWRRGPLSRQHSETR